ncbi:MAG TPA: hypothetical protein DDY32_19455 [Desulfobulbaceae bacterium]|nr:hypothetical protein [Desulfobulbaceae bacterium]
MEYTVQRGDTIAHVTKVMGSDWRTLKEQNPQAVGRSRANGNWFVREGATLSDQPNSEFAATLKKAEQQAAIEKPEKLDKPGAATGKTENNNSGELTHTLKAGETVWELATKKYHVNPEDILKLNNITDPRSLQIGRTLRIPQTPSTETKEVVASWYGQYHHGRPMANGEPFNMYGPTIAHKEIPLGTKVLLENPETGEQATATVTDRGPYIKGRDVDLSYQLAQKLSLEKQGVGNLLLSVL